MHLRKPLLAAGVAAGLGVFGVEIAACSNGGSSVQYVYPDTGTSPPPPLPTCTDGGLSISFDPMYSAYIPPGDGGTHSFQVPAIVAGSASEITWSVDTTMVGVE